MRMISLLSILFYSVFTACGPSAPKEYFIKGSYAAGAGKTVIVEKVVVGNTEFLDSARIEKNGTFYIVKKPTDYNYYRLRVKGGNPQPTPGAQVYFITGPNEKINFTSKGAQIGEDYEVEGSPESQTLNLVTRRIMSNQAFNDSLNTEFQKITDPATKALKAIEFQEIANKRQQQQIEYMKKVVDENLNSLVALETVGQLDPAQYMDYHKKVAESLIKAHPNNGFVRNFHAMITSKASTGSGAEAPEIDLPDPNGKNIKLSSLRGKYVLIDFWASWCRPCRMENPNIVNAYAKYKSKGLEIYAVSLDKEKKAWTDAIAADNLTWIHVSDLQFWNSAAAKLYNVTSIPKSFLLDKEGKIIASDLRGPMLEQKLAELMP